MDNALAQQIIAYKEHCILPVDFTSTKSNFVAVCKKYKLLSGILHRDGKPVLLSDDLDQIWEEIHGDSFLPRIKLNF